MKSEILKEMDTLIASFSDFTKPFPTKIENWAKLHGWDIKKKQHKNLILRQAVLNNIVTKNLPNDIDRFSTPLDLIKITSIEKIFDLVIDKVTKSDDFNVWGRIYSELIPQQSRRLLGQFWTSEIIADWMITWLVLSQPQKLLDIGCGSGSFLIKASEWTQKGTLFKKMIGWDLSPILLNLCLSNFLKVRNIPVLLPNLTVRDFIQTEIPPEMDAIICNPPYTRHHHILPIIKDKLHFYFKKELKVNVSRLATHAFYFLLKIIAEMKEGANVAIIVPMEVLDARYGRTAREVLCQETTLSAIIQFSPEMNVFHNVDVGASILFFKKGSSPKNDVRHLTLTNLPSTKDFISCISQNNENQTFPFGKLTIKTQSSLKDLEKWFSLPDKKLEPLRREKKVILLKEIATVVRGIATGANDFFVISDSIVEKWKLQPFLVRTIHRNREIQDIILDEAHWNKLRNDGKRVWLLYLKKSDFDKLQDQKSTRSDNNLKERILSYISEGESEGYHKRSLVQTRQSWYLMEQREIPPIFYTLLTRGNPRFILNKANVRPLNMFLLIYPKPKYQNKEDIYTLWALLNSKFSLSRLHSVSRTYGGKTLKVEPGELKELPIVNPSKIPTILKQSIQESVQDYLTHRNSIRFKKEINEIVLRILD